MREHMILCGILVMFIWAVLSEIIWRGLDALM